MRFFTIQICDNPGGDECQHEEIENGFLRIIPEAISAQDKLVFCDSCANDIIAIFIMDQNTYPRSDKPVEDDGFTITFDEERIYYTKEVGENLYNDLLNSGYCE